MFISNLCMCPLRKQKCQQATHDLCGRLTSAMIMRNVFAENAQRCSKPRLHRLWIPYHAGHIHSTMSTNIRQAKRGVYEHGRDYAVSIRNDVSEQNNITYFVSHPLKQAYPGVPPSALGFLPNSNCLENQMNLLIALLSKSSLWIFNTFEYLLSLQQQSYQKSVQNASYIWKSF